jgi:AAA15 family ATPase/GTPase
MPEEQQKLLDILSEIIHGTVEYENDTFYIVKFSGERIEFKDEASGYTRLGLLWKLIRNGLFEPGTVLLWDEPENSLNPNVMSTLVDVLFELARQGVQIIATTHDKIFAKYFDINKQEKDKLKYVSLYKEDGILKYDTDERFDFLKPNNLLNESAEQYLREIEKGI